MSTNNDINVSLEPHLAETLGGVLPALPAQLSEQLKPLLENAPLPRSESESTDTETIAVVPYSLLSSISAWTRSTEGTSRLADRKLEQGAYSMVALLAGTRTSPEKKFPPVDMAHDQNESDNSRELSDRRAVTALLNALLSILGSGVAVWWAADKLRWKNEWKVLLSLGAAVVVASAEAVLFLIWNARKSHPRVSRPSRRLRRQRPPSVPNKDDEGMLHTVSETGHGDAGQNIDMASPVVQPYRNADGLRGRHIASRN